MGSVLNSLRAQGQGTDCWTPEGGYDTLGAQGEVAVHPRRMGYIYLTYSGGHSHHLSTVDLPLFRFVSFQSAEGGVSLPHHAAVFPSFSRS